MLHAPTSHIFLFLSLFLSLSPSFSPFLFFSLSLSPFSLSLSLSPTPRLPDRYCFCALAIFKLLGCLPLLPNLSRTIAYILRCQNVDGGFGAVPGAESHAGQTFCCVAALSLCDHLGDIDHSVGR